MEERMIKEENDLKNKLGKAYDKAEKKKEYKFGFENRYSEIFRGKEDILKEAADFNPLEVS
jgi:hypothetical protein